MGQAGAMLVAAHVSCVVGDTIGRGRQSLGSSSPKKHQLALKCRCVAPVAGLSLNILEAKP